MQIFLLPIFYGHFFLSQKVLILALKRIFLKQLAQKKQMFKLIKSLIILLSVLISGCSDNNEMMIEVTYDPSLGTEGFDGRLLVMITKDTPT